MISLKKIFLTAIIVLLLASAVFLILKNRQKESIVNDCIAGLEQASDEELIEKFNGLMASTAAETGDTSKLMMLFRDTFFRYISGRMRNNVNFPREAAYNLIEKLNVEESTKTKLRGNLDDLYEESVTVRYKLIFYDINYLCPGGKENLKIVEECLNFLAQRGVAAKFDSREVMAACRNFCSDLIRYNRDPQLFFAEESEVKVLARYKMADVLRMLWSIRFGGWDFIFREIEKIPNPEDYEFMRDNIVSLKAAMEEQQKESENRLMQFKRGLCEGKF